jgi:hypothetical protein
MQTKPSSSVPQPRNAKMLVEHGLEMVKQAIDARSRALRTACLTLQRSGIEFDQERITAEFESLDAELRTLADIKRTKGVL